jgi:BASS family bile acid:Na+ symporter
MNLQAMILLALKISIVLTVFAVGLNATFSDATFLFRRPGKLIRAFLSMNVVMPFLALVLVLTFNLHPAVKIALAALSVSPVPPFFPKNVLQAGGRENYTVGLLVPTAVLSIVVIPITVKVFEQFAHTPFAMSAGSIAKVVFVTVLAPLMAAIACGQWRLYSPKKRQNRWACLRRYC